MVKNIIIVILAVLCLGSVAYASVDTIGTGLYWDNVSNYLGIGTSTPTSRLHVSAGPSATTTAEFDEQIASSRTCFNVRNTVGAATSFYFKGTSIVVEAKRCL